ncbi:hypothetical protein Y032_0094g2774 [Ancylostoma ceylanicum]|uniref:Uncharacterized protein n=1 Tax=Ancylostoma ceylanicum TaxID=53326 RepID=A0A016TKE4_9BILA|nr:hypothetical protein Y032_0094g2774 [Ancylostoma ceylanicum]
MCEFGAIFAYCAHFNALQKIGLREDRTFDHVGGGDGVLLLLTVDPRHQLTKWNRGEMIASKYDRIIIRKKIPWFYRIVVFYNTQQNEYE